MKTVTRPTSADPSKQIGADFSRKLGYRPGLDGLRAIAIGLVLIEHSGINLFNGGRNGVQVFFVLSGFLITKLMLEEWDRDGTVNVRAFYGRRTVRIMPAPLFMLALLAIFSGHLVTEENKVGDLFREIVWSGTYVYNLRPALSHVSDFFAAPESTTWLAHTWSLATEEQFYLLWPSLLVFAKIPERSPKFVARGLLLFAFATLLIRWLLVGIGAGDAVSLAFFTFDGFAVGIALAWALHHGIWPKLEKILGHPAVFLGALVLLAVDLFDPYGQHLEPYKGGTPWQPWFEEGQESALPYLYWTYISFASAGMIGHVFVNGDSMWSKLMAWGPAVYIGKLSYSLYLWHVPVQVYFSRDRFPDVGLVWILLAEQSLTIVVAMTSYYAIEKPFAKLRKRFVTH